MQTSFKNKKDTHKYLKKEESLTHIVRFIGGLGNQLFQFALYKSFEQLGYPTYADTKELKSGEYFRDYQLNHLGIVLNEADKKQIAKFYGCDNRIIRAIIRHIGKKTYFKQRDLIFDPSILEPKRGYFDGYWQSHKYFIDCIEDVRDSIVFPPIEPQDKMGMRILKQIMASENSVSVHVRLGDYTELSDVYGGICTLDYYKKAMDYISKELLYKEERAPVFFVFSNDIEKAANFIDGDDIEFVRGHSEDKGYIDMNLMHLCKHHIIANSSFSWWGAFLGEEECSMVITPDNWIKGVKSSDIAPKHWIRIDSFGNFGPS